MSFIAGFASALALVVLTASFARRRWRRRARGTALAGRWPFRRLFARLGTSPAQENVLIDEAATLREELRTWGTEWRAAREELATLLREATVDPGRIEAILASRDQRLAALRRRLAEAIARFHAVLDDAQHAKLAGLVREPRVLAVAHGCSHRT